MKISEMTNDQATDAMIRIAGPFESICNDDELIESLEKISKAGDMPMVKALGLIIPSIVTLGVKKHKRDLYEIVAALTMTPITKVGQMNFKETVQALQDSYDSILRDFFTPTAIARRIAAKR